MPTDVSRPWRRVAVRRPSSTSAYSRSTSQCSTSRSPVGTATGPLGKRATSSVCRRPSLRWPVITRPPEAPRSTAAKVDGEWPGARSGSAGAVAGPGSGSAPGGVVLVPGMGSAQEGGRDAGVDGHVQAGGQRQVRAGEGEDGGRDVLGEHLL